MGDRLRGGKPSRYVISHPGQLSLAIRMWVGALSTGLGWEGNRRLGVALAVRHRQQWYIHLRVKRPMKGRWVPRLRSFGMWPSFTFSFLYKKKITLELWTHTFSGISVARRHHPVSVNIITQLLSVSSQQRLVLDRRLRHIKVHLLRLDLVRL